MHYAREGFPAYSVYSHGNLPSAQDALAVRNRVSDALAEDARCRVPGVTDGLYELETLAPFARLGHGVPMIRHIGRDNCPAKFQRAANAGEFRARLCKEAPYLVTFDMKAHGICLAGGAVSALLMRDDDAYCGYHDFDLFLVGHKSDEEARRAIDALKAHLYEQWGGEGRTTVYRTQGCITFHSDKARIPRAAAPPAGVPAPRPAGIPVPRPANMALFPRSHQPSGHLNIPRAAGYPVPPPVGFPVPPPVDLATEQGAEGEQDIADEGPEGEEEPVDNEPIEAQTLVQVVLRRYSTLGEVIHGFDLGSSAALWDGERVLTTALGKLAFECGANVLNLSARRSSYEARLARYFNRGFDLVLPDLNGCVLESLGGRLPYLYAEDLRGGGCSCGLTARLLYPARPGSETPGNPVASSDYSAGTISYGNKRVLASRNARALGGEKVWVASLCAHAPLTPGLDIFAIEPVVDPELMANIVKWGFSGGGLRLKYLVALMGPVRTSELVTASITCGGQPPSEDLIAHHCAERCRQINQKAHIPFAFMTVEDRTALTGPFPRCLVTPEEWYGSAKNL